MVSKINIVKLKQINLKNKINIHVMAIHVAMPGTSSLWSFFTPASGEQNHREPWEQSPSFRRAKFWFWPIVLSVTLLFGFFAGIQGAFVGFFYGLAGGGFLLHQSLQEKKK
jgi:hypothetical protein